MDLTKSAISKLSIDTIQRSELRYLIKRKKNGNPVPGSAKILNKIKALEGFEGWSNFAKTWDLALDRVTRDLIYPVRIVKRRFSEQEEWDALLRQRASDLPLKGAMKITEVKKDKVIRISRKKKK